MGPIAQLVELPAHNRMVGGSSPSGPTTFFFFFATITYIVCEGIYMKYIHLAFLLLVLLAPLGATKYAGEIFSFSPGVQNQAMGNTGLTYYESQAAGWWNPALLAYDSSRGVELMRSDHFEGLLTQNQISLKVGSGTAVSINHLAIDKIKLTKLENEDEEISNDNRPYVWKTVTNQDLIASVSYGRAMAEDFYVGISPKLAYRSLAEHSGYGIGADIGALWDPGKGFLAGINLRDFFGTQILWESGEHEIAMPNLDVELSYRREVFGTAIPVLLALRSQIYAEERGDAANFSSSALSGDIHAGLMIRPTPALKLMAGYDVNSFSTGLGLEFKSLGVNYAFKTNSTDGLGYTQKIALSYSW